jgi:hypothetical protein
VRRLKGTSVELPELSFPFLPARAIKVTEKTMNVNFNHQHQRLSNNLRSLTGLLSKLRAAHAQQWGNLQRLLLSSGKQLTISNHLVGRGVWCSSLSPMGRSTLRRSQLMTYDS